jgi:serine/threonine protein kinase
MGAVYSAEHTLLERPAAIKLLLPALSLDQDMVTRFFNEARAAAAIRHPGIVEIYDFGWHVDGAAYIAMEHLQGESLAARFSRGRMTVTGAATIARQIAGALAAAHRKGIIHRDLKPENVFLVPDGEVVGGERIKLLDFGIAKLSEAAGGRHTTRTGTILGTPTYMAPEQCRGIAVDHRADLYSLGCILFEACTGRPPFDGEGVGDVLTAHVHLPPPAVSSLAANVPEEIAHVIACLLTKDREQRMASAEAVAQAMDAASGFIYRTREIAVDVHTAVPSSGPHQVTLRPVRDRTTDPPVVRRGRNLRTGLGLAAAAVIAVSVLQLSHRGSEPTMGPLGAPPSPSASLATALPVLSPAAIARVLAAPDDDATRPDGSISTPRFVDPRTSGVRMASPRPAPLHPTSRPPSSPLLPPLVPPAPEPIDETPAAPSTITALSVAQLYLAMGEQLRRFAEARGARATEALWTAFRYIRINDALTDPAKRIEADAQLHHLQDRIATASR